MTKSGITRRIDELGRIVIPKEIRSNLGIRDGELLEIYIENNNIVIKKFSQLANISELSSNICKIINESCHIDLVITDREKVIATSKNLDNLKNAKLNSFLNNLIDERKQYQSSNVEKIFNQEKYLTIVPIITSTDCSGLVIIFSDKLENDYQNYAKLAKNFLVSNLDIE